MGEAGLCSRSRTGGKAPDFTGGAQPLKAGVKTTLVFTPHHFFLPALCSNLLLLESPARSAGKKGFQSDTWAWFSAFVGELDDSLSKPDPDIRKQDGEEDWLPGSVTVLIRWKILVFVCVCQLRVFLIKWSPRFAFQRMLVVKQMHLWKCTSQAQIPFIPQWWRCLEIPSEFVRTT